MLLDAMRHAQRIAPSHTFALLDDSTISAEGEVLRHAAHGMKMLRAQLGPLHVR